MSRSVQNPSFPVFPALSSQAHSTLPARQEATDNDQKRLPVTTQITTRPLPEDADLAAVIDAWDRLPEAIKAGILAMVRASG
jgi:hypothetical protein